MPASRRLAALLFLFVTAACDSPSTSKPPVPTAIAAMSGAVREGAVGAELPQPLVVRVTDADGRAVSGAAVQFVVTAGGGSVSDAEAVTDAGGEARTRWTLGTVAGDTQRVEARLAASSSTPLPPAVFRAVGRAAAPGAPQPVGTAQRAGVAGAPLAEPLAVRVVDAFGNPLAGVAVAWQVVAGGGTVTPAGSVTGADGVAAAHWSLGPVVGAGQQVRATTAQGAVDFGAVATLPGGVVLQAESGSGQTGAAGSALADPLVARVLLADGRPLLGVTVRWQPAAGTASPVEGMTDAAGRATAQWTLPQQAGPASLTASVPATGATATFEANVTAAAPASIQAVGPVQFIGPAGEPLAQHPAVRVLDAFGNPVAGVSVSWEVVGGGGSVAAAAGAPGATAVEWTLGPVLGAVHQLRATSSVGTVDFAATAMFPSGVVLQAESGSGQTGAAGSALAAPLVVRVLQADGRPLQGATVRWQPGAGTASPVEGMTDAAGRATAQWTLPHQAGPASLTASLPATGATANFEASVTAAAAASIEAVGGVHFTGPAGEPLAQHPSVRVLDAYGNPVAGVSVSWEVVGGGGSVAGAAGGGQGVTAVQWTLGPVLGAVHQLRATSSVGTVDFAATATFPSGVVLQAESGSGQTGQILTTLPQPLVARVLLADGRPLQGATVRWVASAGEGVLTPAEGVTGSTGRVSAQWILPQVAGPLAVDATLVATGATAGFTATATPGPPTRVNGVPLASYTITAGDVLNLQARVTDAYGNMVPGVTVNWEGEAEAPDGSPPSSVTDASGMATTQWTPTRRSYNRMIARTAATADTAMWRVFVQAGPITQILFIPPSMTLSAPGEADEFLIYTADQYGNRSLAASAYVLHLSSSNTAVATVPAQGNHYPEGWRASATAEGPGTAVITATITELNVSGSAQVQVGPGG